MSADWPIVRLGDYCLKVGSGATPRGGASVYLDKGEICLIRSQNIYNDGFKSKGLVYITEDSAEKLKNVVIEKNDVLLNITGDSVARVCLAKEEYLPARVNQHVSIIRPDPKEFDARYLRYLLTSPTMQNFLLTIAAVGATRNALTKNMIETLEVSKPPLVIQEAISAHLETLDNKIEYNRQTNQTLENISQAIFKSWFVDFEPTRAKIAAIQNGRDPERAAMSAISGKTIEELNQLSQEQQQSLKTTAALFPDTLIDSELGEIPEGWGLKPLEDIAENHSTTFDFSKVDKVVFINTGDVLEGLFLHKNYSSKEGLPGQAKKTIKRGDILYSEIRPKNKRFAYVVEDCDDYVVSTKFMIIRSLGFVHSRYLYQVLRQETTIREFNLIAESRSGTFPQITFDSISYMPVVVPSEEIQKAFMTSFNPIIEKVDIVVGENKSLAKLRDTILPQLLSGELGTENAN